MRLSITGTANQKYIKNLAIELEMTDKEAINYLITQSRLNQKLNVSQTLPVYNDSILESQSYEVSAPEEFIETDPVIERFIALGITEEF